MLMLYSYFSTISIDFKTIDTKKGNLIEKNNIQNAKFVT